ncbi:MAG: PAS domain S-box protein [Methanoregula sp.]|nr:PAS domain S-box protein [Methanoregula sp.]
MEAGVTGRYSVPSSLVIGIVIIAFVLTEVVTFLLEGSTLVIISQVLYFPIILVAFLFPRPAVLINLLISTVYLVVALFVSGFGPGEFFATIMQFYVFVSVSIILASLSSGLMINVKKFQDLFTHSGNPICMVEVTTQKIVDMNPQFKKTLGKGVTGTRSPAFESVFPGIRFEQILDVAGTREPTSIEIPLPDEEGVVHEHQVDVTKIDDEDLVFVTFRDISERKHHEDRIAAQAARLGVINQIITLSSTAESLTDLLKGSLHSTLGVLDFECGGIYLVRDASQTARLEYAENIPHEILDTLREVRRDQDPFSDVFIRGEIVVFDDPGTLYPDISARCGVVSLVSIPITVGGRVIGALNVSSRHRHVVTDEEKAILRAIGRQLGTAIEKMRVTEQLHAERENLLAFFNTIDNFVTILTKDGRILEVNDAVVRKFGYSKNELIGRSLFDIRGPKKHDEIASVFTGLISHPAGVFPFCFLAKDGTAIEAECQVRKGKWDGQPVYFGISHDITERTHSEQMMHRRTAILEAVGFAADRFLKEPLQGTSWTDEIPTVLAILGQATESGRVCIFENHACTDDPSDLCTSLRFEWVDPPFVSRLDDPDLQNIRCRELFPDEFPVISRGKPVLLRVDQLPFSPDEPALRNGPVTLINIPIMDEFHWWGILTIEPRSSEHAWSRIEIDALVTAAEILGSAIHHRTLVEIYQNPVEHSLVGIFLLENGIFRYVNPRFAEMFGYTRDELLGRSFIPLLVSPEEQATVEEHRLKKEADAELSSHYFFSGVRKDGTRISLENYSIRVISQGQPGIISTVMDITERTRAESALKESEEKFRTLSEAAPVGIFLVDSEGNFAYANEKCLSIMGLTPQEAAGTGWMAVISPENRKNMSQLSSACIQEGTEISEELCLLHKDGSVSWVFLRALARRDARGEISGYIGVIVDITERKRHEEALKAALDEKSVLIMEVHHRVKNNLQVISGLIRLQSRYITNEQALAALKECENRVITIALVHESLYQSDNLANINARRHITNLANNLVMSDELGTRIHLELDVDEIPLDMNIAVPTSLIINELVANSLKYAFNGRDKGTIRISFHKETPGNFLVLSISDDGVGLPPGIDILESTSLGLKLVVRLVRDQLGGEITFSSGKGTTSTIRFPEFSPGTPPKADGVT